MYRELRVFQPLVEVLRDGDKGVPGELVADALQEHEPIHPHHSVEEGTRGGGVNDFERSETQKNTKKWGRSRAKFSKIFQ